MKLPILIALMATPAIPSTVRYAEDPEPLVFAIVDGRPSFSKPGPYFGGKLGCNTGASFKDMRLDTVKRDCASPLTTISTDLLGGAGIPSTALPRRVRAALPSATARAPARTNSQAASRLSSATTFSATDRVAFSEVTTEVVTHEVTTQPTQPTPVPLPATLLLFISALGLLGRSGRGVAA